MISIAYDILRLVNYDKFVSCYFINFILGK